MRDAHKSIFVAFMGFILSASVHPDSPAQGKQANPQERSADALENIAASYEDQTKGAERSPYEKQCERGDDQRNSDLCAQWKAADAAADSAGWAAWATWISGISGLFVLVAISLAFQSNKIARDTARRQLRAYVGIDAAQIENTKISLGEDTNRIAKIAIKNFGQSPATIETAALELVFMGDDEKMPSSEPPVVIKNFVLNPGHSQTIAAPFGVTAERDQALIMGMVHLVAHGKIVSVDIYGKREMMPFSFISSGGDYSRRHFRNHEPKNKAQGA